MASTVVVGGAGFIGSALVRHLAVGGEPIRVLDDLSTGSRDNLEDVPGVELVVGSMLDQDLVGRVVDGAEQVFHLACLGVRHSIHSPRANHEANATGTINLLEAARDRGVRRFVYTSTSEVYGTALHAPMDESHPTWPHTVYGGSKLAGEAYVRAYHRTYGMPTVVIRPFNAFGPRSHHEGDSGEVIPKFIVRIMNGKPPIIFGDGTQTRDFTYVDDTARGIAAAARSERAVGETINLGSGSEVSVNELAHMVAEAAGRPEITPVHDEPRPGDVLRLIADSALARELLDWQPEVPLVQGIEALIDWHAAQGTDWEEELRRDIEHNWESVAP